MPIGFSSSLQHKRSWKMVEQASGFQSLSGFQVRCNARFGALQPGQIWGFNPYRVFKFVATQHVLRSVGVVPRVSIPIGFSSSLQRRERVSRISRPPLFQSLSGFQVRCNAKLPMGPLLRQGFNPYRVFKFVATKRGRLYRSIR